MTWVNTGNAVSGGATVTGPYASHAEVALKADNYTTATGSTTSRSMADRFADVVNVKDFGAKGDSNDTGTTGTDDTAAIVAAITYGKTLLYQRFTLFFPLGYYKVSSETGTSGANVLVKGTGPGSKVVGSVAGGFIFNKSDSAVFYPNIVYEDIHITNTSTASGSGGVQILGSQSARIARAYIQCAAAPNAIGLSIYTNNFTPTIEDLRVVGTGYQGIGILSGGHTTIKSASVVGWSEGIRAFGSGNLFSGLRIETNSTGVTLGKDNTGATSAFSGTFTGNRFEANDTDLDVVSIQGSLIGGISTQGSVNSPSAQSKIGLIIRNASASSFTGMSLNGSYSDAALRVLPSALTATTFQNVQVANSLYPGTLGAMRWDIQGNASDQVQFLTSFPEINGTGASNAVASMLSGLSVPGLSAFDMLNGNKKALNLRGKDVPVGAAAVSIAVTFPATHDSGNGIASATPTGGGSLAGGTYYYKMTFANALGESAGYEVSATVDGTTNKSVTLVFYGIGGADAWRRRVYRGRSTGVYDGYYDLPLNSSANFVDTGAAFTGVKNPPIAGTILPSGAEADASYSVACTPQWNASCWVTAKATTGFTLNFSAAPGGGGSFVDWVLIR